SHSTNQIDFKHYLFSDNFLGTNSNAWRLERISRLNQINAFVVTVKCPNYTKQTIGDIVTLNIKSPREITHDQGREVTNEMLSGNYLVRGIRHLIAQGGYTIIMDLVKDSL
ncbi:MAG: hypothetical protein KAS32_20755, partial [Candidatus Peribacteraceae bacterium]|nr:hypothetical protein [Candidatus Peribacteraceae bacterium]